MSQQLQNKQAQMKKSFSLKEAFANDKQRAQKFYINAANLHFDYSKNLLDDEAKALLLDLAEKSNLKVAIASMFKGDKINKSENRSVLHTALRNFGKDLIVEGENITKEVKKAQTQMKKISDKIRSGKWLGSTGKVVTDVVNIGIGGSFLGPKMAINALKPFTTDKVQTHFLANVDGSEFYQLTKQLNPETTLFIVASKSFGTMETAKNTKACINWLKEHNLKLDGHFVAVSSNVPAAKELNIADENIIPMWDFVGGRFSMWSAVGLIICVAIGFENFQELLKGAYEMDEHFQNAPLEANIPVLSGLLAVWYQNYWNTQTNAILPYDHYLRFLPSYLQQLDMESCGKRVDQAGQEVKVSTGSIIWGDEGCNGQHSYHQLLHQGTHLIPCDFVAVVNSQNKIADHQTEMLANCFAQSQALAFGEETQDKAKFMPGNRPSTTILMEELTPKHLGSLIALYEHKVFTQAHIWGINAFDQWGVQLGKTVATKIYKTISENESLNYDASTNHLLELVRSLNK